MIPAFGVPQSGPVMPWEGRCWREEGAEGERAEQHQAHSTAFALSVCQEQAIKKRKCPLSEHKGPISLYNKHIHVIRSLRCSSAYMQDWSYYSGISHSSSLQSGSCSFLRNILIFLINNASPFWFNLLFWLSSLSNLRLVSLSALFIQHKISCSGSHSSGKRK